MTTKAIAETKTEADAIAALTRAGEAIKEPVIITDGAGRAYMFAPAELTKWEVTDPDRAIAPPAHIRQSVTVQTVDSLVDYINAFKTASTSMFADISANRIVALVDYHAASNGEKSGKADHLLHRATMVLPHSEEWKTWKAVDTKLMGQLEFARFLEENAADIAEPCGADLLDACRDLQAVRKVNFTKAVRTATDNENFEYTDETEARTKGGVELPKRFLLRIPVYFGGETHELFAFLRWKLDEGNLLLGIVLHRAEHVRQAVFKQIVVDAGERTARPVLFGSLA